MANLHRGEAEFTIDGARYLLVIDHNALAEAEDAADMPVNDLMKAMHTAPRIKHLRAVLFGALREHHPDLTIMDAGRLMSGGEEVGAALAKAMKAAFPEAFAGTEAGANPPTPPRGIGASSKPRGRKKD